MWIFLASRDGFFYKCRSRANTPPNDLFIELRQFGKKVDKGVVPTLFSDFVRQVTRGYLRNRLERDETSVA
jgi:hypothetical protein